MAEQRATKTRYATSRWKHPRGPYQVLEITDGSDKSWYLVHRLTAFRFRITKLEVRRETSYDVVVAGPKHAAECGCEGFLKGHTECRHVLALKAIYFPEATVRPPEDR